MSSGSATSDSSNASADEASLDELLDSQELYDNHFLDSAAWRGACVVGVERPAGCDGRSSRNQLITELGKYPTVELVDARVTGLAGVDGGFRASIGKRTSTASTVIIATGANDNPPAIPGLAEHRGRGVFTCAYCDGFEHADTHLAVTGSALVVPHIARLLTGWSPQVTAFVTGLDEAVRAELVAHRVHVDERPIARVDAIKRTTVPDVWGIGDVTSLRSNVSMAITDGVLAAVDCNTALLDRDWNEAT